MKIKKILLGVTLCSVMTGLMAGAPLSDEEIAKLQNSDEFIANAWCLQVGKDITNAVKSNADLFPGIAQAAADCKNENRQILPKGYDLDAPCEYGDTLLTSAAYKGHVRRVTALVTLGADVNAPADYQRSCRTPLQAALDPFVVKYEAGLPLSKIPVLGAYLEYFKIADVRYETIDKTKIVKILCDAGARK